MIPQFISETWIIIGIIFIILEYIFFSSINFLFFALGAFCVAILVNSYQLSYMNQFIVACFFTLIYAIMTLYFYKKNLSKKSFKNSYKDIIGKEVIIQSEYLPVNTVGQCFWSGSTWNVKMLGEPAKKGDKAFIVKVEGNILYCSKPPVTNAKEDTEKNDTEKN